MSRKNPYFWGLCMWGKSSNFAPDMSYIGGPRMIKIILLLTTNNKIQTLMKKIFLFAALGLAVMAQGAELNSIKTLVDVQADASKGATQIYSLEYAADGSLYLLNMYQTASAEETGLLFEGKAYQGATAAKWGSKTGEQKYSNMRNSFLAKLDAEGNVLWAKADTTGDYDLANSALALTADGGVIFADKFRTRKGVYMSFFNLYDANGALVATNNMSFTNYDSIEVDGKKVARKEAFSWSGAAQDEDGFVYIAGLQGDTLLPTWKDSIAPRKAWNTKGSLSSNCNTVILKYKPAYNAYMDLDYVGAVINNDELVYDKPLGLHYENGKLYVAGSYSKNGTESGIYAAAYNTNLEREFIQYHPIAGNLQFQQTKFADGKIFICGGLAKGSVTVGEKTLTAAGTMNNGLIYILDQATGAALDVALLGKEKELHITVAALPTDTGIIAYHYGPMGTSVALNYNDNLELVSVDTLALGGGASTLTTVARNAEGNKTSIGLRAKTGSDFTVLDAEPLDFTTTNWYCVIAELNSKGETQGIDDIQTGEKAVKFIQNGQLFIRHNGKTYNVLGM